ncbi:MAG: Outer membrane protein assembly factor BamA [Chlamydiae bacterium]|nr:Outer membrane protein assembly factor BamA [Chlamydiota bacterium]
MTKKLLLLPLLLLALTSPLKADEGQFENKPVKNIVIEAEGLPRGSTFQPKSSENKLRTKVGERFTQSVFDQDLKRLSKEYDRVDPTIKIHQNEVYITLKVWLRPLIKDITFSGNYHFNTNKLKKELGVDPYTLFNRHSFIKGVHKLREYYMKKGYFEAELDYKLVKEPNNNEVTIDINVERGRSGYIDSVSFEGFSKEEISKLKESTYITKFNPFLSWVTRKGLYNEDIIEYEKVKILEFIRDEGYANAKIEIAVTESERNDRIGILIKADKGEFFTIGKVTFSGNEDFANEIVQKKLMVSETTPYSPKKIQDSANSLSEFYGKKGYIDASISYEPHLIEGENSYDLHFKIDEGAAFKVGLIKIIGNNRTFPKVILRETHLEPGNTFDTKMLETTRKRLENVGYYKHVNVYPSSTASTQSIKAPLRDVNIQVVETSTGSLSMNVGFSTVDSVYGGIEIAEKNFNIAGITEIPSRGFGALRGGGEYLKIQTSIGIKITDYSLQWVKPYFLDSSWSVGVNLDKNFSKVQSNSYSIESFTTTVNSYYPLNIFVDFNAFYRLKNTSLHVNGGAPAALRQQKSNDGIISSVGVGLQYETRNNFHRPTQGLSSALTCEYAGVGGDFFYFNYGYNNSLYVPVGPFVFKTKANFNFIQPISKTKSGDVPIGERFFLAADISEIRGYRPFAIGPTFPNGEPRGGTTSAVLSQEVMLGLIPKFIDIFAFADAGTLTGKTFRIDTFRASVGFGARVVAAPNLPLMVGWGYPLNPRTRQDRQGFFLSLSGKF